MAAFIAVSCSNDFLHVEHPIGAPVADTIQMTSFDTQLPVAFNLPNAGNAHWRVLQFPAWMKILPMEGNFSGGKSSFQLEVPANYSIAQYGILDLPLVFEIDGVGLVKYPLLYFNFGNPGSGLSTYNLSMGYQSLAVFTIQNTGGGILMWEVNNKPSWASVSKLSGYLNPNSAEQITLLISRDNLVKGDYSGEINIVTNSIAQNLKLKVSMKVSDPSLSGDLEKIEGDVVDADYCKATGLMVIAAKNPNRIYFSKPNQAIRTLDVSKIPTSITVSETGDQVAATFTNTDLSLISPESMTITRDIQTGIVASDVALGGNGWAYLAPKAYDTNYLLSVDTNTGQIVKKDQNLNGLTLLKKVPGRNILYGTKVGWSPDFLLVFDISNGAVTGVIDEYRVDLWKFWLSEDGQYIFTGRNKVYKAPDYLAKGGMFESPVPAGELESFSGILGAMDHCTALKELLLVYKSYSYEIGTKVLRIDDSGYYTKNTFQVNDLTVEENGTLLSLAPEVPYMFVSKTGQELHLIKKGTSNSGVTYWRHEQVHLK